MENYEDYEEPNNEDLANRLKDLNFEVKALEEDILQCVEQSDQRRRRRKKDNKSRGQLEVEDDIEQKRLMAEIREKIESSEDLDEKERDRLLHALHQLEQEQAAKSAENRKRQRELLDQRRLRRLQQLGTDNSSDQKELETSLVDINAQMESIELNFDQDISVETENLNKKLDELKKEYDQKLESGNYERSADELMAELSRQQDALKDEHNRRLQAAVVARQAKLAAAKRRKQLALEKLLYKDLRILKTSIKNPRLIER